MVGLALMALSALLLAVGAELFAEHAGAAGRRLGVTALAIGLVLAGAEPEELITAVIATLHHRPGIAAGDAIGANLTMLTLVLGLAAVARPLPFGPAIRIYAVVASAAGVAASLALVGGGVGRPEGAGLVCLYVAALALVWWRERTPPVFGEAGEILEHGELERAGMETENPALSLLLVLLGLASMAAGGRLAVAGAERVVEAVHLSGTAVGLTLVAFATTAELLALVWASARRGVPELALAGVLGSVVYNATATLGVAALVRPLAVSGLAAAALVTAALPAVLLAVSRRGQIARPVGAGLLVLYAIFLVVTLG